jgi:hypothetical protein
MLMWRSIRGLGLVVLMLVITGNPAGADEDGPTPLDPTAIFADGVRWKIVQSPQPPQPTATVSATQMPAPTVCDGRVTQAAPGEGEWEVASPDDEMPGGYLCHSATGERRDVLPPDFYNWRVYSSPDENYLLLVGRDWAGGDAAIYSYHLTGDRLEHLGGIDAHPSFSVALCRWLSPSTGVLCIQAASYGRWPTASYFSFTVAQANSVNYAFNRLANNTFWLEDQQRYVTVNSTRFESSVWGGTSGEYRPCTLTFYDANGAQHVPLGYHCIPVRINQDYFAPFYRHGDVLYYLTTDGPDATDSTLRRFDLRTEQLSEPIFTAEIEAILGVSPDERFIAAIADDNVKLDNLWESDSCCHQWGGRTILILYEGRIVYYSEFTGVYGPKQARWTDSQTLVVAADLELRWIRAAGYGDNISYLVPPTIRQISFSWEKPYVLIQGMDVDTNLAISLSPNGQYILTNRQTVFDLSTFSYTPILREGITDQYTVRMEWDDLSGLRVTISAPDRGLPSVEYRVALP